MIISLLNSIFTECVACETVTNWSLLPFSSNLFNALGALLASSELMVISVLKWIISLSNSNETCDFEIYINSMQFPKLYIPFSLYNTCASNLRQVLVHIEIHFTALWSNLFALSTSMDCVCLDALFELA